MLTVSLCVDVEAEAHSLCDSDTSTSDSELDPVLTSLADSTLEKNLPSNVVC